MTCLPAKNLLESYLDDELDAAQTAHVAEHLASCTSCAGVHAQLLELRASIRAHAIYYGSGANLQVCEIRWVLLCEMEIGSGYAARAACQISGIVAVSPPSLLM
jgi:hypothetical protein